MQILVRLIAYLAVWPFASFLLVVAAQVGLLEGKPFAKNIGTIFIWGACAFGGWVVARFFEMLTINGKIPTQDELFKM